MTMKRLEGLPDPLFIWRTVSQGTQRRHSEFLPDGVRNSASVTDVWNLIQSLLGVARHVTCAPF